MSYNTALLEAELAAYTPVELADFVNSVSILLTSADDGTLGYCAVHASIQTTLAKAVQTRMVSERKAGKTATVIPFPKQ